MNYARFINGVSSRRRPSAIRELTALVARSPPTTISLAGGMPNTQLFPFKCATVELRNGEQLILDDKRMGTALQYAATPGLGELVTWLRGLQKHQHNPPTFDRPAAQGGMDLTVTIGAQDGLCKSFEMLINEGDNVLIDCPTYSGSLAALKPLGCNLLAVETDSDGMKPTSLSNALSKWKPSDNRNPESNKPRVLYTVPNGGNPTGASLTINRKKHIYEICHEYDIVILEDDPYYFLQFGERIPSYLSMDIDGRVMRFDSFSKILSSGRKTWGVHREHPRNPQKFIIRLGFATGPQPLMEKLQLHMQASVLHASTMSQVLVSDVLHKWGIDGFLKHVDLVVSFYRKQKDAMVQALNKHMTGLAEWDEPKAGMFFWIKLIGIEDTKELMKKALEKEVVLVPGCAFMPDDTLPCPYVRASFSLASPEQMDMGFERLAALVKEVRGIS